MMEKEKLQRVLEQLHTVRREIIASMAHRDCSNKSIENLNHYLKLRTMDLRGLQDDLTEIGLSSLGRSQGYILNSINKNIRILSHLLQSEYVEEEIDINAIDFHRSKRQHKENAALCGENGDAEHFKTKIMVTLPGEAADDEQLIGNLIANHASVLRINTAHDDPRAWERMARRIKEENAKQNSDVKIYVDLAGPKNRTTQIRRVFIPFKIGSKKDPTLVRLLPQSAREAQTQKFSKQECGPYQAQLVVSEEFYTHAMECDGAEVHDTHKNKTRLFKLRSSGEELWMVADKKVTVDEDTTLKIIDYKDSYKTELYRLQHSPEEIYLYQDDEILISKEQIMGQSDFEYEGYFYDAVIGCSNKEIFEYVQTGDEIYIDDGKIGCKVVGSNDLGLVCEVFLAKESGTKLKEEKGINFPNTDLEIGAITPADEQNFEYTVEYADIFGLSFVQSAADVQKLQEMLRAKGRTDTAIVPKIETKMALKRLPEILQQLLQWEKYGLMIARGDLAIEAGFENMPYIQEEIFDMCEAAHVPVIYATQILEGKMKKNLPSRAEVTDAAFSQRADCVMLNKGPYVMQTLHVLKNILRKMHTIFQKNRQLLNHIRM